jgi:hypothetical protein
VYYTRTRIGENDMNIFVLKVKKDASRIFSVRTWVHVGFKQR